LKLANDENLPFKLDTGSIPVFYDIFLKYVTSGDLSGRVFHKRTISLWFAQHLCGYFSNVVQKSLARSLITHHC